MLRANHNETSKMSIITSKIKTKLPGQKKIGMLLRIDKILRIVTIEKKLVRKPRNCRNSKR